MSGNMFIKVANEFKYSSKRTIIEDAKEQIYKLHDVFDSNSSEFVALLLAAKLGTYGDNYLNRDEKEIITELFGIGYDGDMSDIFSLITKGINEKDYEMVRHIASFPQASMPFLRLIMAFAYIDGEFEADIIEKIEPLFGTGLLFELFNSEPEDAYDDNDDDDYDEDYEDDDYEEDDYEEDVDDEADEDDKANIAPSVPKAIGTKNASKKKSTKNKKGLTIKGDVLVNYVGRALNIKVPENIKKISNKAFQGCTALKSIQLPQSLTEIGNYAFANCAHLEEIIIPDSVTKIGRYCFSKCYNLKKIVLPQSLKKINEGTFEDCQKLEIMSLPESLKTIEDNAFLNCSSLREFIVPDSVTFMGYEVITGCTNLRKIVISKAWSEVPLNAFCNMKKLSDITLPDTITRIEGLAFNSCYSIIKIDLPKSLSYIGRKAFNKCIHLKTISIPNSVIEIEKEAFMDCSELENVELSQSLVKIQENTFAGCKNLSEINIPESVTQIADSAFTGTIYGDKFAADANTLNSEITSIIKAESLLYEIEQINKISIKSHTVKMPKNDKTDYYHNELAEPSAPEVKPHEEYNMYSVLFLCMWGIFLIPLWYISIKYQNSTGFGFSFFSSLLLIPCIISIVSTRNKNKEIDILNYRLQDEYRKKCDEYKEEDLRIAKLNRETNNAVQKENLEKYELIRSRCDENYAIAISLKEQLAGYSDELKTFLDKLYKKQNVPVNYRSFPAICSVFDILQSNSRSTFPNIVSAYKQYDKDLANKKIKTEMNVIFNYPEEIEHNQKTLYKEVAEIKNSVSNIEREFNSIVTNEDEELKKSEVIAKSIHIKALINNAEELIK